MTANVSLGIERAVMESLKETSIVTIPLLIFIIILVVVMIRYIKKDGKR